MAEKTLWAYLRENMRGKWHARRHEDSAGAGVPDVSFYLDANNWMELKEIKKLPTRATTGINLGQWHKNGGAQRHFLIKRHGWLFIRVNYPDRCYLLFNYKNLPPWEKPYWTWSQMSKNAFYIWEHRVDFETLALFLRTVQ